MIPLRTSESCALRPNGKRDIASFGLAPIYDMLPMLYAPAQGNVVEKEFKRPAAQYEQVHVWAEAKKLAVEFWRLLSLDERVSAEFRKIAAANMKMLRE